MSDNDRWLNQQIEDYKIETLLGRGGMGAVYKGFDRGLRRPVAIKMLDERCASDPQLIKRFQHEAQTVAGLNHPNIAQVYRAGESDGAPFYVMEYIEGRSLSEILREKGRLGGSTCVEYVVQAARGLQAAAEHGIIHRDIKPANLMVTTEGVVKIVDFGIAKNFADDTLKTATGAVMGTPTYMSPEQGKGIEIDLRTDIYSLGVTFYHMVAGCPPFHADNPMTLIMKHIQDDPPPVTKYNPNIPEKIANVIHGMIAKNPLDRFQEYQTLIVTLENLYGPSDEGIRTCMSAAPAFSTSLDEMPRTWRDRKEVWIGAGVGALLLLLAIGMLFSPSEEKQAVAPQLGVVVPSLQPGAPTMNETMQGLRFIKNMEDEMQREVEEFDNP